MFLGETLAGTVRITLLVFVMMVLVDYVDVRTQGRLRSLIQGRRWRQYTVTSLLGATPGCLGAFMSITLYVHGFLTFGAIVGSMIATCGDEAFVMLVMFPKKALLLFALLFVLGVLFGWVADWLAKPLHIIPCEECKLQEYHPGEETALHYVRDHVWGHIVRRHIWRVFAWTFLALLLVDTGMRQWELDEFVTAHMGLVLILSALIGVIPESGPNLIFVTLFADGVIPFSVLLTNAIVQDGHGMLPLLSYTVKDAILIKAFNLAFALAIGSTAYFAGL